VPVPIRLGTPADAAAVAALHSQELAEGFLVTLGTPFLVRLYTRIARYRGSFLLVMGETDDIEGFIAVAERTGDLYREFLVRDGLRAGLAALPAIGRAPRHVWETLRYGTRGDDGTPGAEASAPLPDAEILSVAVDPAARGHGAGRALVAAATAELGRRGISSVRVVTAADNGPALRTYEAAGFTRRATTQVHAGVEQVVLAWP
jgi:ribosomal protein S18 acetylase RimI-like enzyme